MGEVVLVTGGSGYVGGWCVAELLRRGYQVRTSAPAGLNQTRPGTAGQQVTPGRQVPVPATLTGESRTHGTLCRPRLAETGQFRDPRGRCCLCEIDQGAGCPGLAALGRWRT